MKEKKSAFPPFPISCSSGTAFAPDWTSWQLELLSASSKALVDLLGWNHQRTPDRKSVVYLFVGAPQCMPLTNLQAANSACTEGRPSFCKLVQQPASFRPPPASSAFARRCICCQPVLPPALLQLLLHRRSASAIPSIPPPPNANHKPAVESHRTASPGQARRAVVDCIIQFACDTDGRNVCSGRLPTDCACVVCAAPAQPA